MSNDLADLQLSPERPEDAPQVDALIARAFGPGRFAKTAERLREGGRPILELSIVARLDGDVVGCVRLWPVTIGDTKALLLGPFAVDDRHRGQGLGAALINRACAAATDAGHGLILLVGDAAYFTELGFSTALAARVIMPGPVDRRRVLLRELIADAAAGVGGAVRTDTSALSR